MMDSNGVAYRPALRLVNGKDRPKLLEMIIRSADNGYTTSASFNGLVQNMVFTSFEDVISYLQETVVKNEQ